MERKLVPSASSSFSAYTIILAALFVSCGIFVALAMKNINQGVILELKQKQEILSLLKNMRIDFANEHNAITYGLSDNTATASRIYDESEKKLRASFDKLKEILKEQRDRTDINSLTYNQAMFSEQVNRMLKAQWARKGQSLTYDELVDIKSYTVQSLMEANKHAEAFNKALTALEEHYVDDFNARTSSLMKFLLHFKKGVIVFLILLFLLAFIFGFSVLRNSLTPLRTAASLLKQMSDNRYSKLPDYSQIQDSDAKAILKSFNMLTADFRNFANQSAWSLRELAEINSKILSLLRSLKSQEDEAMGNGTETAKLTLEFSQELENVRFYIERMQETIRLIHQAETLYLEEIRRHLSKMNALMDGEKSQQSLLEQLASENEKIGMLAVNINLEASKLGDNGTRFTTISNEIRKLVDVSKETVQAFLKMNKNNRTILDEISNKMGISSKFFDEMTSKIQELILVNDKLDEIRNKGMSTESLLIKSNKKESKTRRECLSLISETEKEVNSSNRAIESALASHAEMDLENSRLPTEDPITGLYSQGN
jgi:methyl-accepting chemotaxis protein